MSDLVKRLRIKAGMIEMGERIAWGSDVALMREAADALEATARGAREDYKLVPVEPTAEMVEAGKKEADWYEHNAIDCYKAMLAAAPAVQGEPVAWQVINIKYPKMEPATYNRYPDWAEGDRDLKIIPLYATPQPAERQEFKRFNGEECWLWAGDGSDRLETLTCPVVISPTDLMAIINQRSPAPDVDSQILKLIEDECRYWHGRDEARQGGYASLYAKAKEMISKQQREPCHECGGNGAGGEHEDDCSQQVAPDVAGLAGKMARLIAAGNRLNAEAEECTYDEGIAEVAGSEYWCEFRDALDAARAAIAAPQPAEQQPDATQLVEGGKV